MYYRIWCSALVVLGVVVWSCVVSCVHCVKITVRTVTFTKCTQLTTQLHTTTDNHSQHNQCRTPYFSSTWPLSPDDGHNDARNTLGLRFDNKHRISCILLVSLSSPYGHDARSQEPKIRAFISLPFFSRIHFRASSFVQLIVVFLTLLFTFSVTFNKHTSKPHFRTHYLACCIDFNYFHLGSVSSPFCVRSLEMVYSQTQLCHKRCI